MSQQPRYTPEDRVRILGEWATSGLSGPKFAAGAGMSTHTLYLWRRRAKTLASSHVVTSASPSGPFAEVVLRPGDGPRSEPPLEIAVGDAVVRVGAAFDDAHLRRVLDVVRAMA